MQLRRSLSSSILTATMWAALGCCPKPAATSEPVIDRSGPEATLTFLGTFEGLLIECISGCEDFSTRWVTNDEMIIKPVHDEFSVELRYSAPGHETRTYSMKLLPGPNKIRVPIKPTEDK